MSVQILLPKFLSGTRKVVRKQTKSLVTFGRGLAKSSADKRAIEGQSLAPEGELPGKPPVTLKELVEAIRQ